MFLLVNKSRAKAFRHTRELLLSSNKVSAVNSMRDLSAETFRQHLLEKYSLPPKARARVENPANSTLARPLRELWEATDLSAAEFADEVSDYWGVVRLSLPQLLASTPCLDGFSRRFLRGVHDLPGARAQRQLPAGGRRSLGYRRHSRRRNRVRRAGRGRGGVVRGHHDAARPAARGGRRQLPTRRRRDRASNPTTISRACAISPAAHRWCARSTICWSARSSFAPATFTSSRFAPASWCACASTACCARCRRRRAFRRRR